MIERLRGPRWIGIQSWSLNSSWGLNSSFFPSLPKISSRAIDGISQAAMKTATLPKNGRPLSQLTKRPPIRPAMLGHSQQDSRPEVDREEDEREHGSGQTRVLSGRKPDDQDRERDHPGARQTAGPEPAHGGPAVAALDGALDGAVRRDLDPVHDEPDPRHREVAGDRQVSQEEDREGHREQNQIQVAEQARHPGFGRPVWSVEGQSRQLLTPDVLWMMNERMKIQAPNRNERPISRPSNRRRIAGSALGSGPKGRRC